MTVPRALLAAAAALALAATARAGDEAAAAPAPGRRERSPPPPPLASVPTRAGAPAAVHHRLPNGLRVVVLERHRRPLVVLRLILPRGSATDPPRRSGATWLAVNLASDYQEVGDHGERIPGEKSLRREAVDLGGALSVDVEPDFSTLSVAGYSSDAGRYLDLLARAVIAPRRGAESFAGRRDALLDALEDLESSDPEAIERVVAQAAFGAGHPYARSVIGTSADLGALGLEDVVAQQEAVLVPGGATLLVVGDVQAERVIADARRTFRRWERQALPLPSIPPAAAPRGPLQPEVLRRRPATTLVACVTRPLSDVRATDGALRVFTALLGDGTRSRLALALREEGGFTYAVSATVVRRRAARALVACAPLDATRADEGVGAFRAALTALRDRPPSADELRRAQALRLAALDDAQEDVAGEAAAWTEAIALGEPAPHLAREEAEIAATTAEDVRRIAAAALRAEGLRWIFSGDPAVAVRATRANGLGRLVGASLGR